MDDYQLDQFEDHWNPILVRELRRMLKRRSFLGSYLLLMFVCWISCLFLILQAGPELRFVEKGNEFCCMYYVILLFAVCLILPMSVFSTCSQERLMGTWEMVAITGLKTSHLINGYFCCGVAQVMLYGSSIVPFISFSYLLQGVGIFQIIFATLVILYFSAITGVWGLMLGTFVKSSVSQTICSILTVLGSLFAILIAWYFLLAIFYLPFGEFAMVSSLLGGLFCFLVPTIFFIALCFDISNNRMRMLDPMKKPYLVVLDSQGNVVRFKRRFDAVYDEVLEWNNNEEPELNSRLRVNDQQDVKRNDEQGKST